MTKKNIPDASLTEASASVSRRGFLKLAGASGIASAAGALAGAAKAAGTSATADGTPEQIHLTWGEDPTSEVVVSWASQAASVHPRVVLLSADHGHGETSPRCSARTPTG